MQVIYILIIFNRYTFLMQQQFTLFYLKKFIFKGQSIKEIIYLFIYLQSFDILFVNKAKIRRDESQRQIFIIMTDFLVLKLSFEI